MISIGQYVALFWLSLGFYMDCRAAPQAGKYSNHLFYTGLEKSYLGSAGLTRVGFIAIKWIRSINAAFIVHKFYLCRLDPVSACIVLRYTVHGTTLVAKNLYRILSHLAGFCRYLSQYKVPLFCSPCRPILNSLLCDDNSSFHCNSWTHRSFRLRFFLNALKLDAY